MSQSPDKPNGRRRNGGSGQSAAKPLPDDAPPAERFAALRSDIDGLEEVCRWQWNLLARVRQHIQLLPADWPAGPNENKMK